MAQSRVPREPINALSIPFQNPILDHVAPDGCGVIVEFSDDRVEVLLGVSGGGGELLGNSMEDCDSLGRFSRDRDQCAVGVKELVDLLGHGVIIKL